MTDPEDIPTIRESLRDGVRRVEMAVGTWFSLATLLWVLAAMLAGVADHPQSASPYLLAVGVSLVLSVLATAIVLRYRPAATERLGTFAIASTAPFLVLCTVALPGWNVGSVAADGVVAVPVVLLGWLVSIVGGYAVVYRRVHARLWRWLSVVGDR